MGQQANQSHVRGRDQKFYAIKETTSGVFVKATTAASMNVLTTSMAPDTARKPRIDALMASRDVVELITGKNTYQWSANLNWVPSGTKNTPPDFGDMVLAALGTETVNANDVTYSLASAEAVTTLSLTRHCNSIWQESLAGAWVEEMKLARAGGDEPKVSFSGGAMSYAASVPTTLDGAMVATTAMVGDDVNAYETSDSSIGGSGLGAHSVIQVDADDNSSAGHDVIADDGAGTFTLLAAATGSDGNAVVPYVPTHTDAGSPISGTSGTFTIDDSFNLVVTGFEITIKNNIKPFDDEAFTANVRDLNPGMREITGSITFRARQDHLIKILDRTALGTIDIDLAVGGAAQSGTRLEIAMPYCAPQWGEVSIPETEEATHTMPFRAIGSSGNDAITFVHT